MDTAIHYRKITTFSDDGKVVSVDIIKIEVKDVVKIEDLVRDIMISMRSYVKDGMGIDELCHILKTKYGIAKKYCCDIIEQIKIELDMWCPDRRHLYFVNA